jgi:predicted phosphodiesterase
MGANTQIGSIVKCALFEFGPDIPHLRLAKVLAERYPHCGTVQNYYDTIRYYRGKRGRDNLKALVDRTHVETHERSKDMRQLPETLAETWEPFRIAHAGGQRILVLSDIHFPYHDPVALNAALDYGHTQNPTIILLNGDLMDCHEFGVYERDPRKRHVAEEMEAVRSFFALLREEFPLARIIWKLGNHEERWSRWMMRMAPQLLGIKEFDLYGLVKCAEHGVELVSDKRVIYAGKLHILHGHEFGGGGGGVNPARWLYLRCGESAICGHFHRTSEHMDKTISQSIIGAWSTGSLCEMHPKYMPINRWNHGFAFVNVENDGNFRVGNFRIINGKVY